MTAIRQAILDCLQVGPCILQKDRMDRLEEYIDQMVTIAVTFAVMPHIEISEMLRDHVSEFIDTMMKTSN